MSREAQTHFCCLPFDEAHLYFELQQPLACLLFQAPQAYNARHWALPRGKSAYRDKSDKNNRCGAKRNHVKEFPREDIHIFDYKARQQT